MLKTYTSRRHGSSDDLSTHTLTCEVETRPHPHPLNKKLKSTSACFARDLSSFYTYESPRRIFIHANRTCMIYERRRREGENLVALFLIITPLFTISRNASICFARDLSSAQAEKSFYTYESYMHGLRAPKARRGGESLIARFLVVTTLFSLLLHFLSWISKASIQGY